MQFLQDRNRHLFVDNGLFILVYSSSIVDDGPQGISEQMSNS